MQRFIARVRPSQPQRRSSASTPSSSSQPLCVKWLLVEHLQIDEEEDEDGRDQGDFGDEVDESRDGGQEGGDDARVNSMVQSWANQGVEGRDNWGALFTLGREFKSGLGKWAFNLPTALVDKVWERVAAAVDRGALGPSAQVGGYLDVKG